MADKVPLRIHPLDGNGARIILESNPLTSKRQDKRVNNWHNFIMPLGSQGRRTSKTKINESLALYTPTTRSLQSSQQAYQAHLYQGEATTGYNLNESPTTVSDSI